MENALMVAENAKDSVFPFDNSLCLIVLNNEGDDLRSKNASSRQSTKQPSPSSSSTQQNHL